MTVNSIGLAQTLVKANRKQNNNTNIAFRGEMPDLDALRAKQDEFKRMSEQSGENGGAISKLGGFASKAIGVLIAFTATKICLGKAAELFTGNIGKVVDKTLEKVESKAKEKAAAAVLGKTAAESIEITNKMMAKSDKLKAIVDKVRSWKIDEKIISLIAGGAAVGVAMKDFGLVKKEVSSNTEHLVDKAIDKANENDYNTDVGSSDEGHDISGSSSDDDYTVDENEF